MNAWRARIMARFARRYDIYLPVTYNVGCRIPDKKFRLLARSLAARFGGLTMQQRKFPLEGIWQGEAGVFFDRMIVMTVLDFRTGGSGRFIADLKKQLLAEFEQLEILITQSPLRV